MVIKINYLIQFPPLWYLMKINEANKISDICDIFIRFLHQTQHHPIAFKGRWQYRKRMIFYGKILTRSTNLVPKIISYHPPTHHHPHKLFFAISQPPVVRFERVRPFFDSTQSQESKSEVCAQEFHAAMHIKTPFDNAPYLSSLGSNLSMWGRYFNLRNTNLRSALKTPFDNALYLSFLWSILNML